MANISPYIFKIKNYFNCSFSICIKSKQKINKYYAFYVQPDSSETDAFLYN